MLKIIAESHEEARRLLRSYRAELDKLAEALLAHETLDEKEILDATGLPPAPPPRTNEAPVGAPEEWDSSL